MMTATYEPTEYGDRWIVVNNLGARYGTESFTNRGDAESAIIRSGLVRSGETIIGDYRALQVWASANLPALHDDVPNPTIEQILAAVNDPDTDSELRFCDTRYHWILRDAE